MTGEFIDGRMSQLFTVLSSKAEEGVTKFFLVSDVRSKLPLELESRCMRLVLSGLEDSDTAKLVRYWFEEERGELPAGMEDPPQRFVSFLGGHPLAAKIGAGLWAEHPSDDPGDRIDLFDKLRDRVVPFILQHYTLNRSEKEFLTYASIFRLPVHRELFVSWGGDDAADVLDSFTGRFLMDTSEEGYELHPLIRDAFYPRGFTQKSAKYHSSAGEYYARLLDQTRKTKGKLVPAYLGEAIHHFLAAGDRVRVQGLAFYKSELRQVGLTHYRGRAYDQALVEYRALADLDPGDADAQFHLALLYGRNRQWPRAEEHFGRALNLSPEDHRFLQGFGAVKMRGDLLLEAEELLREAHEIAPRHSPTLVTLGELMERRGLPDDAEAYYEDAIAADDESSYAHLCLARLLNNKGDWVGALREAKAAMSRNPVDRGAQQLVSTLQKRVAEAKSPSPEDSTQSL
ncbi:MAG: tetratricopeptide repeat protein [Bryobacterales bacterium]